MHRLAIRTRLACEDADERWCQSADLHAHSRALRCLRWPGAFNYRERYGVSMQMNVDTICRRHSFFSQRWINSMLRKGYIDVAATDAHNVTSRPCRMRDGYQALQKRFGQEMADRLCIEFPGQI
ncbi:MAG: CpsB/CapC family capsule biosynthesis tyrosine phosphatase [Christensenellales bacterium]